MIVWMSIVLNRTVVASSTKPFHPKVNSLDSNSRDVYSICHSVPKLKSMINISTMLSAQNTVGQINSDS